MDLSRVRASLAAAYRMLSPQKRWVQPAVLITVLFLAGCANRWRGDLSQGELWTLALNVPQSSYRIGEAVSFQIGIVDQAGETVCDGLLSINVRAPDGNTTILSSEEGTVRRIERCGNRAISDTADYTASFVAQTLGIHVVTLTVDTPGGPQSLERMFAVSNDAAFTLIRNGATRLFPQEQYDMRFTLRGALPFSGTLIETVPFPLQVEGFSTGATLRPNANGQEIHFPVRGEEANVWYRYVVPTKSPALHALGPIRFRSSAGDTIVLEEQDWLLAVDAVSNSGILVYSESATNPGDLNNRLYTDPTTSGAQILSVATDGQAIRFVKVMASPTREEFIAVHQKETGRMDVLTCTGGCNAAGDWSLRATMPKVVLTLSGGLMRGFDVAYEQLSGDAIVVFGSGGITTGGGNVHYCVWDGTSWTPSPACGSTFSPDTTNDIDMTGVGVNGKPEWVRLVARGQRLTNFRSDEMLVGVSDHLNDLFLAHWTGSAWDDESNPVDDLTNTNAQKFDLAYEETTGAGLAVVTDDGVANLRYSIYTTSWGGIQTDGPANNNGQTYNGWIDMANDPLSDDISVVATDSGNDVELFVWTGAGFSEGTDDISAEATVGHVAATAWTRNSQRALYMWTDASVFTSDMECWTSAGGFTSVVADVGNPNISNEDDVEDMAIVSSCNNNRMLLTRRSIEATVGDDIRALTYSDATGCADADWVSIGELLDVNAEQGTRTNTVSLVHHSSYVPYSPWSLNWRFYDDETVDDPSTGLNGAAENVTPTSVDSEEFIRLRMNMSERAGGTGLDIRKKLQYTSGCNPDAAGGEATCTWVDVGDTGETSAVWRYATAAETCTACTDGNTSTTSSLTGTDQTGPAVFYVSDKDAAADLDFDHFETKVVEIDFPLKAEDVGLTTTYYFRLYEPVISSVGMDTGIFREQDNDGANDCATAVCTYPSLTTATGPQTTITGTVYSDEGTSVIGANITVALSIDGAAVTTSDDTDAGGMYTFSINQQTGAVLTLFLNDETEDGVLVSLGQGNNMTGMTIYQDHLIARSESGAYTITSTHLNTSDGTGDDDLSAIYSLEASNIVTLGLNKELWVWVGDTYTPGARIKTHDLSVSGSLVLGTNGLVVSGSLIARTGTLTTSTGILLNSRMTSETLSLGTNATQNLTLDNGLIGYWKFDEGRGATAAKDSSQYGNHGVSTNLEVGTDWSASVPPRVQFYDPSSLDFDGVDEHVRVTNSSVFNFTRPGITVATWFTADTQTDEDNNYFISKPNTSSTVQWALLLRDFAADNPQGLTFIVETTGGLTALGPNDSNFYTDGAWHHVAGVYDGVTQSIYIDGALAASTPKTGTIVTTGDMDLFFGTYKEDTTTLPDRHDGKIDDIRIYNRALTASEINALYNGGKSTGSGVYVLGSNLDVNGNLNIYSAALDASAGNYNVTLSGSAALYGDFTKRSGTFTLDGGDQTISGSTVFHNFTKTVTSAQTLTFDHTSRQSISGALTLRGAASNLMSLRTTKTGSASNLLLDGDGGSQTIDFLDVLDSDASGGDALVCSDVAEECTDSGRNTNWDFGEPPGGPAATKHWGKIWLPMFSF
ncbi:hypothetical protein A3D88_02790 [Candidatus Peribacteria bacterium RIFCSPHIGHO2_02_FULL_52_16]|nr:MAG: hypothetical protein A2706_00615 [Candidatus Peribacteria bacterium RIFCSPHIGHO2_01_FULL_51_35]OGJ61686.1 MAG: hypothetical protein A3D88_02790 [Candidatus Peribacteria bacterium RIFCSPHIGHO2_02_FULL_52_16]